jgi:hypothetical protein
MDDIDAQLAFVRDDLAESPMLIALRPWVATDPPRLVLRGRHLNYQLREYRLPRQQAEATWDFAYCDGVDLHPPAHVNILGHLELNSNSLNLMPNSIAAKCLPRLRGKLTSWNELRRQLTIATAAPSRDQQVHRALTLTQFLDALYAAADVFPVQIMRQNEKADALDDDSVVLKLKTRRDSDRDALSNALGLKAAPIRMDAALLGDNVREEGWILTDTKSLGERSAHDTEWQFQRRQQKTGSAPEYVFTGPSSVPLLDDAFLVPAGSVGRDVQFRRRLKALRALKDHIELLTMLSDPRNRILDSHDKLKEDEAFNDLDVPKQDALRELTDTVPLYLVQGPPGVGKTRLVRDLVRRRFDDEPTTRILLAAQSNAAVDHLMDELDALLKNVPKEVPLVVRCRSKESANSDSPFEIGTQSQQILVRLLESRLAAAASPKIQRGLKQLAAAATPHSGGAVEQVSPPREQTGRPAREVRAFESVVVRAANVVFATTNSGELERLIDERAQFDWAIVEEAGKAAGGELLSPLLLSHRRLMIGDHKQLPPFGSDQVSDLLKEPASVTKVLQAGEEFIGRSLRDPTTEEILDEIEEEEGDLPALCSEAIRVLTLFEGIIEKEFQRQASRSRGRPIAKKLTAQHRMHPIIAELVSRCFYDNELKTDTKREEKFKREKPPFTTLDQKRLPTHPIVVVDMPYLQDTIGMTKAERLPRWHNPDETTACVEILSLLRSDKHAKDAPSIAVLSPYAQQVRRLNTAIDDLWEPRLTHLGDFKIPKRAGGICGTVDAFQGSEADVVIVSLVRNNQHSNMRNALGFLSDLRRMNVLLSRSRWQLVLVCSLRFLNAVVTAAKGTQQEEEIRFLGIMLAALAESENKGLIARIPFAKLVGTSE